MPAEVQMTIVLTIIAAFVAAFVAYLIFENECMRDVVYRVEGAPQAFDGFRIVVVSDLHNKKYGKHQQRLLARIAAQNPDMIAVTGDLYQNEYTENALDLIRGAAELAPVYYVIGNHEAMVANSPDVTAYMQSLGVHTLDNNTEQLVRGDDSITVVGLSDPMTFGGAGGKERRRRAAAKLDAITEGLTGYRLLLSHRPEMFDDYVGKVDLALAGHSHAGHVRLPFIGAIMTPGEGFKVKYDVGRFDAENTTMIVSGGLGASNIVPRFHNRPQLVTVELAGLACS